MSSVAEGLKDNESMTLYNHWHHDDTLWYTRGFQRYGVRYQNGRLIVPYSGWYHIYSFMGFYEIVRDPETNKIIQKSRPPIRHSIYKYDTRACKETQLACNSQTRKDMTDRYDIHYQSNVETLAFLNAGDEILIRISDATLPFYEHANIFGLHMVQ